MSMHPTHHHRGYTGTFEFDDESGEYHGRVSCAHDVITFQAATLEQIEVEFGISVDDYLAWCEQDGREPATPS